MVTRARGEPNYSPDQVTTQASSEPLVVERQISGTFKSLVGTTVSSEVISPTAARVVQAHRTELFGDMEGADDVVTDFVYDSATGQMSGTSVYAFECSIQHYGRGTGKGAGTFSFNKSNTEPRASHIAFTGVSGDLVDVKCDLVCTITAAHSDGSATGTYAGTCRRKR
jgi:hypothetical protein